MMTTMMMMNVRESRAQALPREESTEVEPIDSKLQNAFH